VGGEDIEPPHMCIGSDAGRAGRKSLTQPPLLRASPKELSAAWEGKAR